MCKIYYLLSDLQYIRQYSNTVSQNWIIEEPPLLKMRWGIAKQNLNPISSKQTKMFTLHFILAANEEEEAANRNRTTKEECMMK